MEAYLSAPLPTSQCGHPLCTAPNVESRTAEAAERRESVKTHTSVVSVWPQIRYRWRPQADLEKLGGHF